MNQQNDMSGDWLENWYSEAEALFEQLPTVPPGLENEVRKLLAWKAKSAKVADEYWQARERLWLKRREREDARKRVHAIAERQRIATEMELAERRLRKWQHKLRHLKDEIDRITDEIISEMRRRHERAMLEAALLADAQMQQKAEDDLHVWEIFRRNLEAASRPSTSTRKERERRFKTIEQRRQEAEEKRLRQEYEAFLRREAASHEDNQAAWQAFLTQEFETPVDEPPLSTFIPSQNDEYIASSIREEFETLEAREMPSEADNDKAWREFIEEEFSRFPYNLDDDEDWL